ncbi:MAG: DNA gyrase subunit A [Clostridiales bacterium]|nr:DNA gyrase subunit A [Clostridiales bacterium]
MKKVDYSEELLKIEDNTKYIPVEINGELKKSFISYAMAVNVSRAIPDVRDGLKPVQRRIIYAMGENGYFHERQHVKCARIVGEVMGKYHPHGDSSIYEALVRLAQDFSINCPQVDGHGNFGSVDGDPAAAQRYTEARLSKIAGEMLKDINKDTVDFYPNYDNTEMQPRVLPSRFPNILVNGSDGIAVGMATYIPPHNLTEVINGVVALIDDPEISIDDLMEYIPAPDYPTKGLILGGSAIKHAYKTGRGGVILRARTEIEENINTGKSRIIVTELPYQVNKARLIVTIADMVKDKRIEGIANIQDESGRDGLRIVIDIKKDYNPQVILNFLFKHTQLQVSNGIILLALVDNQPKLLNLKEILYHYLEHQKEIVKRRTIFDKKKAEERAHILEGLVIALKNIDEVIALIKGSKDKNDANTKLMEKFNLTEAQSQAILDMRLQRLTNLEDIKIREELDSLKKAIADYIDILSNESRVLSIIKTELLEIREKFGTERKTEITLDYSGIDIEDLIEKEDVVISLTHQGYVKRIPVDEYRSQHRGGRGVSSHKTKEEDYVENIFITSTHDYIMFFTNLGRVYKIKGYEIPEASKQAKGRAIINLLQLTPGERVTAMIPIPNGTTGNLMMATKKGLIKKTDLAEFESIRKVGKIAIKLVDDDELINVQFSSGEDDVLCASSLGKCIRFNEKDVRQMGRTAQGVKCMNLKDDDYIVDMIIIKEGYDILTITSKGYGKRSDQNEYRTQGRNGKGVYAGIFNDKTGRLVNLKQVLENEDVIIVTDNGTLIRTHADTISKIGRATQGVKVMRLAESESVVSIATADRFEEDNIENEDVNEQDQINVNENVNEHDDNNE